MAICNFQVTFAPMEKVRTVIAYGYYFYDFYVKQPRKVQVKIAKIIEAIEVLPVIPANYLRFIENTDGLYEARIQLGNNIFRVFCIFDGKQFVVLLTGFQKKTQKTPPSEIEIAVKLMKQYFEEKKGDKKQ